METKKIIFIVMGLFLVSLVCAAPPIPNHFMGNVTIYGEDALIGTEIMVYVAGNLETTYSTTQLGEYDLYVKTGNINDDIEFKINDKLVESSTRTTGETIILNLEISDSPAPVISPVSPPASPSGGGGGGGGTTTYWKCVQWNDWSECSNEEQTRTCAEKVECSFSEKVNLSETKNCALNSVEIENKIISSDEIQETTAPGITGAVTGFVKTGKGIGLVFVFLIIVFGIGVITLKKKALKNE